MRLAGLSAMLLLAACDLSSAAPAPPLSVDPAAVRGVPTKEALGPVFPAPDRAVADIVSASWSDEGARDNAGEATEVFRRLGVAPGLSVADIGAGSGYYTSRLAPAVGPQGQVFANDIIPDYLARLRRRIEREGHANVRFVLGDAGNANLPPASVDLALMVHMYHEISDPFGLLWHLHESLNPGGRLAVIDADRPTGRHGTPPELLRCELEAVGFHQTSFNRLDNGNYLAVFTPAARPEPSAIKPCRAP
jgi:predicted methyltransferase